MKVMFCYTDLDCGVDGICVPCMRKENVIHNISPDIDEYNIHRRYIEICEEDLEHGWIVCRLRDLDPMREIFQNFY